MSYTPRPYTLKLLYEVYRFKDDTGTEIQWTDGQIEIIDCILHRSSPDGKTRVQTIASTRYGKSLAVAAGIVIRASTKPEKWAIVAGTKEKAQIIMDYVLMFSLNSGLVKSQLATNEPIDRLRQSRAKDRIMYRCKGEVRVFSAGSTQKSETSKALMGFGSPNVVEDEAALIGDKLQATVMRMLGDSTDNFLFKIGNPFNRNHFLRTWNNPRYYRIFIDYIRAIKEGRYTADFIEEMREEDPLMFDINFGCKFPDASSVDESGWMYLFSDEDIEMAVKRKLQPNGRRVMGVDVARGGRDYNCIVIRQDNYAWVVKKWRDDPTDKQKLVNVANEVENAARDNGVEFHNIYIDDNGVGGGVTDILESRKIFINPVNFAERAEEHNDYINVRAESYAGTEGLAKWIKKGSKLENHAGWYEATQIRFKKSFNGKIKIEPKEDMRRRGLSSPDVLDALAITFAKGQNSIHTMPDINVINSGGVRPLPGMPA